MDAIHDRPDETGRKPRVFLDSNIVQEYQGKGLAAFFGEDALNRFSFVINPVVVQEVLLATLKRGATPDLERVTDHASMEPIDLDRTKPLLRRARDAGDRSIHSNDLLNLASARDCEYFVTNDAGLLQNWDSGHPKMLSLDAFEDMIRNYSR